MDFSAFALNPKLMEAIKAGGFTTPTPIQAQTLPQAIQGMDVMACAQTGSGKTAAFVLPSLHRILSGPSPVKGHGPRVLVLTPTRELAQQITDNVKLFSKFAQIRSGVVIGGVSYGPQFKLLAQPLDMLIATPGRLIDHMNERKVDLSRVETLILDEADRMLDMGFLKPVEKVIAAFHNKPQILLFSATFSPEIEKIAAKILRSPHRVQLAQTRQNHADITQIAYTADNSDHKLKILSHILENDKVWQAIVFTATKRGADKLSEKLNGMGHKSSALHGDMKQNARKRTLEQLHKGTLKVLVATDVAARGLDVKNLSHVVNYDLPNLAEDFTHRIGRTGRAGAAGTAISLVSPPDLPVLRDIEKHLGKRLQFSVIRDLEPIHSEAEFRALVPSEPPPGRPVKKGRGGHQGPRKNFSDGGRSFARKDSSGAPSRKSFGGKPSKPARRAFR